MVTPKPGLLPGTMSRSLVLSQLGSVISVSHSGTKGHTDAHPVAMLVSEDYTATKAMESSGTGLLLRAMSRPYHSQGLC